MRNPILAYLAVPRYRNTRVSLLFRVQFFDPRLGSKIARQLTLSDRYQRIDNADVAEMTLLVGRVDAVVRRGPRS